MVIGLISDTHGLLRESALRALRGVEIILHAGDVGDAAILEALGKVAPVVAVRGNVDTAAWAEVLPVTAVANAGSEKIYMLHDVHQLAVNPCSMRIFHGGERAFPQAGADGTRRRVVYQSGKRRAAQI